MSDPTRFAGDDTYRLPPLPCRTCGGAQEVSIEEGEPDEIIATMPCPDCGAPEDARLRGALDALQFFALRVGREVPAGSLVSHSVTIRQLLDCLRDPTLVNWQGNPLLRATLKYLKSEYGPVLRRTEERPHHE